jgi:anti-anti-sigma factor
VTFGWRSVKTDQPSDIAIPMTFAIRRDRAPDGLFVRLIGNLDSKMADAVTQAIVSTTELRVVIDLSELQSVDAGGLKALLEAGQILAATGKRFSFVGAEGQVKSAIQWADLEGAHRESSTGTTNGSQAETMVPEV